MADDWSNKFFDDLRKRDAGNTLISEDASREQLQLKREQLMSKLKKVHDDETEIDRLRAENEAMIKRQAGFLHLDDLRQAMIDAADENNKLKAALSAIRSCTNFKTALSIAAAALRGEEKW